MVKLVLEVSMILENVKEVKVANDKRWYVKVQCTSCYEASVKWHYLSTDESVFRAQGKAKAHFVFRCPECRRESTLNILEDSIKSYKYNENKPEDYQPLVTFDARGLEPISFDPRDDWIVVGPSKEFDKVAFENSKDWADYDDIANEAVSILEFTFRFKKV